MDWSQNQRGKIFPSRAEASVSVEYTGGQFGFGAIFPGLKSHLPGSPTHRWEIPMPELGWALSGSK